MTAMNLFTITASQSSQNDGIFHKLPTYNGFDYLTSIYIFLGLTNKVQSLWSTIG